MNNELYHFGVKGMKWGVRRFEGKGGSYTRKGVSNFHKSVDHYEKTNERYKKAKATYNKKNQDSRIELTNSRLRRNEAKRDVKKKYNQIKDDYKADKGKELYSKGHRIISGTNFVNGMATAGVLAVGTANHPDAQQVLGTKGQQYVMGAGFATMGVSGLLGFRQARINNRLRAYYSHSR